MTLLLFVSLVLLAVGHIWFAWTLWTNDQPFMAALLLVIPMPLIGLLAWYLADWDPAYKTPAIVYLSSYALVSVVGLMG
jgi:hypothetical protein